MTKLQEAAYGAQLAAALPTSALARDVLSGDQRIDLGQCAAYIHAVQQTVWFRAAFAGHADLVTVLGGRGVSRADADQRWVRIGVADRGSVSKCEQACLHELAHIVTPDCGPDNEPREPARGRGSSRGHHHAWRANFILIVRKMLGGQAALGLRHEFDQWGLPTHR
jgi:hypothetical protein